MNTKLQTSFVQNIKSNLFFIGEAPQKVVPNENQFGVDLRWPPTLVPSFFTYGFTTTIFLFCVPLTLVFVFAIISDSFLNLESQRHSNW